MLKLFEQMLFSGLSFSFYIVLGRTLNVGALDDLLLLMSGIFILLTLSTEWVVLPITTILKNRSEGDLLITVYSRFLRISLLGVVVVPLYMGFLGVNSTTNILLAYLGAVGWLSLEIERYLSITTNRRTRGVFYVIIKWSLPFLLILFVRDINKFFLLMTFWFFSIGSISFIHRWRSVNLPLNLLLCKANEGRLVLNSLINVLQSALFIKLLECQTGVLGSFFIFRSLGNVLNPIFSYIESYGLKTDIDYRKKYRALLIIVLFSIGSLMIVEVAAPHLILGLYGEELANYSWVFRFVLPLIIVQAIQRLGQAVIRIKGYTHYFHSQRVIGFLQLGLLTLTLVLGIRASWLPFVIIIGYHLTSVFLVVKILLEKGIVLPSKKCY